MHTFWCTIFILTNDAYFNYKEIACLSKTSNTAVMCMHVQYQIHESIIFNDVNLQVCAVCVRSCVLLYSLVITVIMKARYLFYFYQYMSSCLRVRLHATHVLSFYTN